MEVDKLVLEMAEITVIGFKTTSTIRLENEIWILKQSLQPDRFINAGFITREQELITRLDDLALLSLNALKFIKTAVKLDATLYRCLANGFTFYLPISFVFCHNILQAETEEH